MWHNIISLLRYLSGQLQFVEEATGKEIENPSPKTQMNSYDETHVMIVIASIQEQKMLLNLKALKQTLNPKP